MNIKKELGEKIRRIRKHKKITQEKLAEMVDIAPRNLYNIEVGTSFVKAETLEKILVALNISTEELFANDHLKEIPELINEINKNISSVAQNKQKLEQIYKITKYLINE